MARSTAVNAVNTRMVHAMDEFAGRLRRLMAERGIGVRALARRVPCDPGLISRLANGRQRPSSAVVGRLDEVLGADGALAAMVAKSETLRGSGVAEGNGVEARGRPRVLEALQHVAAGAGPGAGCDALFELVGHYSEAVAKAASVSLYDELLSARSFANDLLSRVGHVGTGHGSEATVVAGWLSSLLAVAATDLGDHAGALVWCSDAERRGQESGHPELVGWAALTRSLLAYYQGRAHRSAVIATRGQDAVPIGSVAHARLAAQKMRALALLGDEAGMARAKKHAAAAIERLPADGIPGSGVFSIPLAEDPPYTATSLLLVKRYRDAAEMTRRLIETAYRPEPGSHGSRRSNYARVLLILGLAAAGLGDIEDAAAAGAEALECSRPVWSTLVLARKLDHALADRGVRTARTAGFHARYVDARKRLPAAAGQT